MLKSESHYSKDFCSLGLKYSVLSGESLPKTKIARVENVETYFFFMEKCSWVKWGWTGIPLYQQLILLLSFSLLHCSWPLSSSSHHDSRALLWFQLSSFHSRHLEGEKGKGHDLPLKDPSQKSRTPLPFAPL